MRERLRPRITAWKEPQGQAVYLKISSWLSVLLFESHTIGKGNERERKQRSYQALVFKCHEPVVSQVKRRRHGGEVNDAESSFPTERCF